MSPILVVELIPPDKPPCRCIRCDSELPPLHSADHLCSACFLLDLQRLTDYLIEIGLVQNDTETL
jgi:hypothetical protein